MTPLKTSSPDQLMLADGFETLLGKACYFLASKIAKTVSPFLSRKIITVAAL